MVVIIIGISSNICSLDISGLSHVNDGHKALLSFDAFILFGTKWIAWLSTRRRHRKQTYELHPNTSNSHVDIIGTEMWPQICYKLKYHKDSLVALKHTKQKCRIKQALDRKNSLR